MKSKKVALYAFFDSLTQIVRSILSVYVRHIFIRTLGDSLMGLNGLFSSVLSFLSLTELGFASVVAVCLYENLAKDDRKNISAYMYMLRKVYWFMGCFILIGGMLSFPIVLRMVNGEYEANIVLIGYFLHLLATSIGYFCSYRSTLLYANQEGYVVSRVNLTMYTISLLAQIFVLLWKQSYFGFLICTIVQNFIAGVWITNYTNKKYGYLLDDKSRPTLQNEEKRKFQNKFKAMLIYKISDYFIQGADNMIISVFLGTVVVGYYNNYNLIINMCWAIFASVAVGSVAGIGNLIYTDQEKVSETLFRLLLLQHFIFCISATGVFQLSSLFVTSFLSEKSVFPLTFVLLITMYYYFRGMTHPLESVRMGAGAYEDDKWKQLLLALLNVVISIIGCMIWGIQGVVVGTLICYFVRGIWLTPKQIFGKLIKKEECTVYFRKLFMYCSVTIIVNYILFQCLEKLIIQNVIIQFIIKGIICVAVPLLINLILFCRTKEFDYLICTIKNLIKRSDS